MKLARMTPSDLKPLHYTRLINGVERFTPPGLLFGLVYAWYLDNRLATHIEYKMSIMRQPVSELIPEQANVYKRRKETIMFFRDIVFRE